MVAIENLTRLELQAMKAHETEYGDLLEEPEVIHPTGCDPIRIHRSTWTFAWIDEVGISPKILRGVMSSLIKKDLISVSGDGNEETISYTDEGRRISKILNGVE